MLGTIKCNLTHVQLIFQYEDSATGMNPIITFAGLTPKPEQFFYFFLSILLAFVVINFCYSCGLTSGNRSIYIGSSSEDFWWLFTGRSGLLRQG